MKLLTAVCAVCLCAALMGCNRTERAIIAGGGSGAYVPGENFGDGGESRCGTVNVPPALKPCE